MDFAMIRALASSLVARSNLASRAGMTFGNERDLFAALGYKRDLTLEDYRERFERNGIAARVVDALPKATWRNGAEIIDDDDPENTTEFETQWQEFEERLRVWSILMRADILAGLGHYAVVLIGAPGKLEEPLEKAKAEEILYLSPFSERDAKIEKIVEDQENERFGKPEMYQFDRLTANTTTKTKTQRTTPVHWTRVLHIADNVLDEQIFGEPRLKNIWNFCDDLEKVAGSGSEAYWLRVNQGTQFNLDKDVEMNETERTELKDQVDDFTHGIRRVMRTRGMDINVLGSDVSPFAQQLDSILTLISGSTGIPKRILTGSEMGHLASTQDRNNWHERIEDRRTEFADPWVIRPLVDRLIELGAFNEPKEGYEVRWPHITKMDDKERSDVADKLAGVNKKIGETIITGPEIRDRVLQLPPLNEVIDLDEEEEEEPPAPPMPPPEEEEPQPVLDENGEPVLDENGVPVVAQGKKSRRNSRTSTNHRSKNRGKTSTKRPTETSLEWYVPLRKQ